MLVAAASSSASAQTPPTFARLAIKPWRPTVIAELPTGNAEDALGVHRGVDEERARGPSAIIATGDNQVLIIDGEKERAVLVANKRILRKSRLPVARTVSDAVHVGDGRVVLFDGREQHLWMVDATGSAARMNASRLKRFKGLRRITAGRVVVEEEDGAYELDSKTIPLRNVTHLRPLTHVAPPPPPPPPVKLTRMATKRVATRSGTAEVVLRRGEASLTTYAGATANVTRSAKIDAPGPGRLASVTQIGTDKKKRTFLRIEMVSMSNGALSVKRYIRVLDFDLKPLATFEIPVDDVIIADKDIDVDEDGNVFVMLPYADKVKVVRYAAP